jgi:hypothetical protein
MGTPRLTDEVLRLRVIAYNDNDNNQTRAAKALGISRESLQTSLKQAAERGLLLDHKPAMPGFRIAQLTTLPDGKQSIQQKPEHGEKFEVPKGMRLKGVTALTDAEGRIMHMHQMAREGVAYDPLEVAEWLKGAFNDYRPCAAPVPAPAVTASSLLTLVPANDWHVNMSAWGKQTGTPWDLKIAEPVIGDAVVDAIERSPPSAECIILGGGDLLHVNGKSNTTVNGTPQDTDSRFQKGVEVLGRILVRTIDAALHRHQHITARILKGNHDEDSSVALVYFLFAWYRNEPRVTIDTDPSDYFWFRFGKVMLGAAHGHQSSNHIAKMPGIMAHRRAADWGLTKFRYVHGFHLHHSAKIATEGNGCVCEIHQAPIPHDAWHFASGFLSGRSIQAITYHKDFGEIGRVRAAIIDAEMVRA